MTVRFSLVGPPDEIREVRAHIELVFGPRLSTDTDLLNTPATLARWHGDIEPGGNR